MNITDKIIIISMTLIGIGCICNGIRKFLKAIGIWE